MYCHLCRVDGSPSHESSSWHRAAKDLAAVAVDRLSDYLTAAIDECCTMYCHLCRVDESPSHESSSWHRAAKDLAAVAVDRLSDSLTAAIDDDPSTPGFVNEDDCLKVKLPKTLATEESNKTQVFFCDSCNVTLPVADWNSHQRQKEHTLALFNEQTFEELVRQYVDKEHRRLMMEPMRDPQVAVDGSEVAKTYTCHLCALEVPYVFKFLHEGGLRHLSCRTLTVAAAKRMRDQLRSPDKSADKSEDKSGDKSEDKPEMSEDKPEDGSGDQPKDKSKDKLKISGKMMKKLLKLYTGKVVDEDIVEDTEGEPEEPKVTKSKRLTTKQYFTEILPYMSFVSAFHTVIVDDTEFITIQIGRDTLRIHINNYNGINHYERHGMYYMNCVLCDGYNASNVYSSANEGDKAHVMSLGHIKNLLAPIDNAHLIRKIDETHAVCVLCNVYVSMHSIENHILRDPNHTTALIEALERGKTYKDSKKHLKIMVCQPNKMQSQPHKWSFGIPQLQRQNSSRLFGEEPCDSCRFGGGQIQSHNVYRNASSTGLFGRQTNAGYGNGLSVGFGIAQNNDASLGTTQNNGTTFGTHNITGFGSFGSAQNNTAFGSAQTNTAFGSAQNSAAFGSTQNNTTFGSVQNNGAFAGSAQNNGAAFGSAQNNTTFGSAQNNTTFGGAQNNTTFGSAQNSGASNNKTLNAFGEHSIFKTPNKNNIAAIQKKGVANTVSSAATKVGMDLVSNQSSKQKSTIDMDCIITINDKSSLTSGLTKTQPDSSEKAEKPKSPSEKNVKFTFHSNDAGAVNKNGNGAPKNGNEAQDKPDVGNKQNNNKRNVIHYSSSSSDSE